MPTPTPTKCIQSTPHTIPQHENIIHFSLSLHTTQSLSPCPWPLWMTQIVAKMHISRSNDPPGFFLCQPLPQPNVSNQLLTPSPTRKYHSHLSPSTPPNLWALVLDPSELNDSNSSKNANDIFVLGDGVRSWLDTFGWGRGWHKKTQGGSLDLEICIFATIWVIQRGQGQGLRDWVVWRERSEWYFRVGGWCKELIG